MCAQAGTHECHVVKARVMGRQAETEMSNAVELLYSHRFFKDFEDLEAELAQRVLARLGTIETHGVRYPGLETRRVRAQRDPNFHLIDVDAGNRLVVYLQGERVLCERVGAHDPIERWAETASVRDYIERARTAVKDFTALKSWYELRAAAAAEPAEASEIPPTFLEELAVSPAVSDVIARVPIDYLQGYREGVIEDWMIFLSPVQRVIVERKSTGPSRVSGGPGTGKTVVALHRAARLADELGPGSMILLTSYVRTLPPILANLYERLRRDGDAGSGDVEFRHIVEIARSLIERLEGQPHVDNDQARSKFSDAWAEVRADAASVALHRRGIDEEYAWEEVRRVIKGRGLRTFDQYRSVKRYGRRVALGEQERAAIWRLAERYDVRCSTAKPPLFDQDTLIAHAVELAAESKVAVEYDAIVIDEAQDLTEMALAMLLNLTANGPRGLVLLAGDGGQRIYPGGYRLLDLGVDVRGRAHVLRQAYRSTRQILESIAKLGRMLSAEDFGEEGLGSIPVTAVRDGPPPNIRQFGSDDEELDRVAGYLRDQSVEKVEGTALLVPSNRDAKDWRRALRDRGVPAMLLSDYDGTPNPAVKVGTYTRAKGLEFRTVLLPGLSADRYPTASLDAQEDVFFQQAAWFYVAMGRARDQLLISFVGEPSILVEELLTPETLDTLAVSAKGEEMAASQAGDGEANQPVKRRSSGGYRPTWEYERSWRDD